MALNHGILSTVNEKRWFKKDDTERKKEKRRPAMAMAWTGCIKEALSCLLNKAARMTEHREGGCALRKTSDDDDDENKIVHRFRQRARCSVNIKQASNRPLSLWSL